MQWDGVGAAGCRGMYLRLIWVYISHHLLCRAQRAWPPACFPGFSFPEATRSFGTRVCPSRVIRGRGVRRAAGGMAAGTRTEKPRRKQLEAENLQ